MGVDIQEFVSDKIIGNIRTGARGENDRPIKFGYFDVHLDKTTSSLAVELFNQTYKKPQKLKIRFIDQHPIDVYLERYDGRKRRCYGNNKEAKFIDDSGKLQHIKCNANECEYKKNKKCKFVGRLYFVIDKLEDEGIWCYPIGNQKGIAKITRRIARANRIGEDLTKDWYELFLVPEDSSYKGKNYVPDIRKAEIKELPKQSQKEEKKENIPENQNNNVNYLMIKELKKEMIDNKNVSKIVFVDTNHKEQELLLMPESKQDILKLKPQSIILPLSISRTDKISILNDYKIIKVFSEENKKAV